LAALFHFAEIFSLKILNVTIGDVESAIPNKKNTAPVIKTDI
jgi:hypothetical protein